MPGLTICRKAFSCRFPFDDYFVFKLGFHFNGKFKAYCLILIDVATRRTSRLGYFYNFMKKNFLPVRVVIWETHVFLFSGNNIEISSHLRTIISVAWINVVNATFNSAIRCSFCLRRHSFPFFPKHLQIRAGDHGAKLATRSRDVASSYTRDQFTK